MGCKGGEFVFIDRIKDLFSDIDPRSAVGIGDDCAVIGDGVGGSLVVTCDMVGEGVHFLREAISAFDLGYKSLAVNLSDVAAMGAEPVASFLSVGFDAGTSDGWREEFMRGYHSLSKEFGVPLLGGDTTSTMADISISVTAIGRCSGSAPKLRSGARAGQQIFVTSMLGDSAGGLKMILGSHLDETELIRAHTRPRPHVREGLFLGGREEVSAMMDISDGLASDLRHIMAASGVGAVIEQLPISGALSAACSRYGLSARELALSGGEDYSLLFTVDSSSAGALVAAYRDEFGLEPYRVGYTTSSGDLLWAEDGVMEPILSYGYIHRE